MPTVADVISEPVVVSASYAVQDVSAVMLDAGVEVAVIVCGGGVGGLLSAMDLAHALLEGEHPGHTPLERIAHGDSPLVRADEPLAAARERMRGSERPVAIVAAQSAGRWDSCVTRGRTLAKGAWRWSGSGLDGGGLTGGCLRA